MKKLDKRKKTSIIIVFLLVVVLACTIISSKNTLEAFSYADKKLPIYSVDTEEKKIAITFDTTWGDDNVEEILNLLDKYDAKATFFVIGLWADDFPDRVKEIDKRGHEIGNHSNKHPNMTNISKEKIIKELDITDAKLLELIGKTTNIFRFPEGAYNDLAVEAVESTGRKCIQWDIDSIDWKKEDPKTQYDRVIKKVEPGSILLFHTNTEHTVESLEMVLEKLKSEGYKFVKTSDILYEKDYHINGQGKQIKNK